MKADNVIPLVAAALTPKQAQAAALLAEGLPVNEVASRVGRRAETISRWKREPAFSAAVGSETAARIGATRSALADLVPEAVETLRYALDPTRHFEIRLKAALAVLKMAGVPVRGVDRSHQTPDLFGSD